MNMSEISSIKWRKAEYNKKIHSHSVHIFTGFPTGGFIRYPVRRRAPSPIQKLAGTGGKLYYHASRERGFSPASDRSRKRFFYRSILETQGSDVRNARKWIQGRALSSHQLCQSSIREKCPLAWLGNRPGKDLYHSWGTQGCRSPHRRLWDIQLWSLVLSRLNPIRSSRRV